MQNGPEKIVSRCGMELLDDNDLSYRKKVLQTPKFGIKEKEISTIFFYSLLISDLCVPASIP